MPPNYKDPYRPVDTNHMLPPHRKPIGPMVGTIIIVLLLIIGALYFWGASLNRQAAAGQQTPFILPGTTTVTVTQPADQSASSSTN